MNNYQQYRNASSNASSNASINAAHQRLHVETLGAFTIREDYRESGRGRSEIYEVTATGYGAQEFYTLDAARAYAEREMFNVGVDFATEIPCSF